MIINLSQSVPLKQLCRISAVGHTSDTAWQVEFTFSHEAIIGFATELLWLYEDITDTKKLTITTHQLQVDPAPNQAIGFYLTPDSPLLVIKVNSLEEEEYECDHWKEIRIKEKNVNQYYNVKSSFDEEGELITLEAYELSRKNIVSIHISNHEGNDVTEKFSTVIFEINRSGIKDLATMLLVWANNCQEGDEYILPRLQTNHDRSDIGYNLGVILDHKSISAKFMCHALGTAHDYDPRM